MFVYNTHLAVYLKINDQYNTYFNVSLNQLNMRPTPHKVGNKYNRRSNARATFIII